ncbi:MAG: pyridoxal phosphate-dependent decarboxylase family protein [Planctomycetota bacterium]|jgi:aromatic-L-amino-acid decarboxylase
MTPDTTEFRTLGHQLVDRIADYFDGLEDTALFPDIEPHKLDEMFAEPVPSEETPLADVMGEVEQKLLPYCTHVSHPGYFGLITPTPLPVGALADFLASALNQNVGTYVLGPSATAMERRVVRWLDDLVGYGDGAGGNLTSGGTMANFLGLKLGRDFATGDVAQHQGLHGDELRWAVYVSEERHVAVDKAADVVGVGREFLRVLPTDDRFCLRIDALEQAIAADKANGVRPMCIVGIAGTTNTGSIDDLATLRRIADREGAWLHVDAAYGGGMLVSKARPGLLVGLELADSITLDPHKWFYAPLDAGALLVKDETRLTRSFGMRPPYLTDEMDEEGDRYQYFVHGFEQSRRFRGLKVWMGFKRHGTAQIGRWVDQNVEQATRLYQLADQHPDFEPAVEPNMSAVCLRYQPKGLAADRLPYLHRVVARRIEDGGRFWISTTFLKGKPWFRVNPVNFRTRLEHMDGLFQALLQECEAAAH